MKSFIAVLTAVFVVVGYLSVLPVQTQPQPPSASETAQKCPEPTPDGMYFERGVDRNGNLTCGFSFYNPCPYFEAAKAGTPECERAKPTRQKPSRPAPTVNQYGGK